MDEKYMLIGADLVPTVTNECFFKEGHIEHVIDKELNELLSNASYRIFNLETPLTNMDSPIKKCGPNLKSDPNVINGLKKMNIDLFTLANNHIMDYGEKGLESTLKTLNKADINYVGVGNNVDEAIEPFIFTFANRLVGVYACAEHEFSIAQDDCAGANPYDSLTSYDHIIALNKKVDYIIVLYHGGKEHYRYPSPLLQKRCRKFIDKGADLVICQHSHCIGCEEKYNNGTIVYGQGNFIFDYNNSDYWKTSILLKLDSNMNVNYIPLEKVNNGVKLAEGESAERIMNDFKNRSMEIRIPGRIKELYDAFSNEMVNDYFYAIWGRFGILFRLLSRIIGKKKMKRIIMSMYGETGILPFINYLECEAHYELLKNGVKNAMLF